MPTATWFTGQTSGAGGGAGFGTGAYTTTDNSYPSPTAGALLCVWVFGLTNNAGTLTGGSFSSSVGSGTNPTFSQHAAGWVVGTNAGGEWVPFCTMFYVVLPTCTNLRFICDATDSIYQWNVVWTEYRAGTFDPVNPFGRWGSDLASTDTMDNEVTTLDQNTTFGNVRTDSHVVAFAAADGAAGAIAPGSGWTERYEGPSGSSQAPSHLQEWTSPNSNDATWGAWTPTITGGGWVTLAIEVRHVAITVQSLADSQDTATTAQTRTTGSFTPADQSLLVVWANCIRDNHATAYSFQNPTTSAGSFTWTQRVTPFGVDPTGSGSNFRNETTVWTAPCPTSPGSITLTVDAFSGTDTAYYSVQVFQIRGCNLDYPLVQAVATNSVNPGATDTQAQTVTLGANPVSGNGVVGLFGPLINSSSAPSTPSGYTALVNPAGVGARTCVYWRNDTTTAAITSSDLGQQVVSSQALALEFRLATNGLLRTVLGSATTADTTGGTAHDGTFNCGNVNVGDVLVIGAAGTPNSTTRPVWTTPTKASGTATIGTVTQIAEGGAGGINDENVRAWWVPVTADGDLVLNYGDAVSSFGCDLMVLRYTGTDSTSPITGAVTQNTTADDTQLTDSTLAATPRTSDEVVHFVGFDANSGGASAYTYPTGVVERILPSATADFCMSSTSTRAGIVSTSTTVDWPNENVAQSVFSAAGVAFIVQTPTAGTTGTAAVTLENATSSATGTVVNPPALVYVKEIGFVTNTTAGTTSAITVAAGGAEVGDLLVIAGSCDNTGASGAATTISVADNSNNAGTANTYTLQTPQAIADPGAASAGQQGFFVTCVLTRSLDAGDTITITYGNSTAAKAINCQQWRPSISGTPTVGGYATQDNQTGQAVSVATGTNPVMAGQVVCTLVAVEGGTADAFTQDTDTTNGSWVTLTRRGSGTTTSGATLNTAYKIVTAAGAQTYNGTTMLGTARDHCAAILVLTPPPITGTVAQTLADHTSSASGTAGAPDVTGTVAVTLADFTPTASGLAGIRGGVAVTLANFTSSATAVEAMTGTVAVTLANATSAASGTETITGTVAVTLAGATSSASGVEIFTGTVAVVLADATGAASGLAGIRGGVAVTLDPFTSGVNALETMTGTVAVTLAGATSSASGTVADGPSGTVAAQLANFTSSASGQVVITGTVAVTLADATPAASGLAGIRGPVAVTLADATSSATATEAMTGTVAATLQAFTSSASGTVGNANNGTVAAVLADFTSGAAGTVAIIGTAAITLANFTSSATGNVPGATTLGQAALVASGRPLAVTPGAVTVSAARGALGAAGRPLSIVLGGVTRSVGQGSVVTSARPLTVVVGAVAVNESRAVMVAAARPVQPVAGAITVALVRAIVATSARPLLAGAFWTLEQAGQMDAEEVPPVVTTRGMKATRVLSPME